MLCDGKRDHEKLLACKKIPYRVQERLDRAHLSDADREVARKWIRSNQMLDMVRDNWSVFARNSPLTGGRGCCIPPHLALAARRTPPHPPPKFLPRKITL
jgi:hypothetical protein